MAEGITVRILGDNGPFSRTGKSIGYQLMAGESVFLIDCGAPLFGQIGGHGLKDIDGLVLTHCHDDHKRWFTDLALFGMYAPDARRRVFLLTSEDVHNEVARASSPALDRSLSADSMTVRDIPFSDYVDFRCLGPRARYRIAPRDEGRGVSRLTVEDLNGDEVGPDLAKVVVSDRTGRARLLFRDPESREWVEPESFYAFSSSIFYEENRNIFEARGGFRLEAVKAPVWHGIPTIGLKVSTAHETLVFSSDTVNDTRLWKRLCSEKRPQKTRMSAGEFERAAVLYGDINDFIERTWSESRYREALKAYEGAVVIHDVSTRAGAVHTNYEVLSHSTLERHRTILTHSPDRLTSEWALCSSGKSFTVRGNEFFEVVDGRLLPMDADIYHKDRGRYFVGFRNGHGRHTVFENDGLLSLSTDETRDKGEAVFNVDLFEDIGGRYFELLEDENSGYVVNSRGQVERLQLTDGGLRGTPAEDMRGRLPRKPSGDS